MEISLDREWLVTNGLGGSSFGTVAGLPTRSYHGLLIAALPPPLGRLLLCGPLREETRLATGEIVHLSGAEYAGGFRDWDGGTHLGHFGLTSGLPVWVYHVAGHLFSKNIWMPHLKNTVLVRYEQRFGEGLHFRLLPSIQARSHHGPIDAPLPGRVRLRTIEGWLEFTLAASVPPLYLKLFGDVGSWTAEDLTFHRVRYRNEEERGLGSVGPLFCPGYFEFELRRGSPVTLVASCEPLESLLELDVKASENAELTRRRSMMALTSAAGDVKQTLTQAADQFVIVPPGRDGNSIIAGYPWFTDWGRDTMIGLEGLTLLPGRLEEAAAILRQFAGHVRRGLLPNYFPDGDSEGVYHTADAALWFFHAAGRYLQKTGDRGLLRDLLPAFEDIVAHHVRGTDFGIGVDPRDGLLRQGAPGYQLTWMDAKVGAGVVTPRRGKAVEINALWFNALCLLREWRQQESQPAGELDSRIIQVRESFNERFWNATKGVLFDVVDGEEGDDAACRPNQLFALSLTHPVLDRVRWLPVLQAVQQRLLTPVGLRSLAPGEPGYQPNYCGDMRARDTAYHQGTVWSWLIGPFVDAWLRVHPEDRAGARRFLAGLIHHLDGACVGSVSEIFDAEPPHTPRGCVAQAWGVSELLRCWIATQD